MIRAHDNDLIHREERPSPVLRYAYDERRSGRWSHMP
jgi:hypothetical protein